MKLNIITLVMIGLGLVVLAIFVPRLETVHNDAERIAGIAIAFPALCLLVVARLQLGRAFSVRAKATTLVTAGLYSRIRNPIYFFAAFVILGIIIWSERPWLLVILLVLIPLQMVRARKEEQVLTEKFGSAYLEYKQKTWF
jgi:protein-S-isoprenylcysteine O-methyltransferase Ste14